MRSFLPVARKRASHCLLSKGYRPPTIDCFFAEAKGAAVAHKLLRASRIPSSDTVARRAGLDSKAETVKKGYYK
jgi:hypothetical protein